MNKLWMAVPVVAVVAASPLMTAPRAEKAFAASVTELDQYFQSSGIPVNISQTSYEKGFLGSTSVNRIEFSTDSGEPVQCLELITELGHGYAALATGEWVASTTRLRHPSEQTDCTLGKLYSEDKEFASFYDEAFGTEGPLLVSADYGIAGKTAVQISVQPFEVNRSEDKESADLRFSQLDGEFEMNAERNEISFDLNWPGLVGKIEGDGGKMLSLKIGQYKMSGVQQKAFSNLWVGPVSQQLGEVDFKTDDVEQESFHMASLAVDNSSQVENNQLSTTTRLNLNGLGIAGQNLGDVNLSLDLSGLDAKALNNVLDVVNQLNQTNLTSESDLQAFEARQDQFLSDLVRLAETGVIDIRSLDYSIGENKAHIDGKLNLDKLEGVPAEQITESPFILINHLKVKLNGLLDEALVSSVTQAVAEIKGNEMGLSAEDKQQMQQAMLTQFTQTARGFAEMGYLKHDAEASQYSATVEFGDGQAKINGQPIDVPVPGR